MTPVVLKQSYYFRGSGCVTKGSAQRVTERGGGRREGTSAGQLLSGKRSVTGGGGEWRRYRSGRRQGCKGEYPTTTTLVQRRDWRHRQQSWRSLLRLEGRTQESRKSARARIAGGASAGITCGRSQALPEGAGTVVAGGGEGRWRWRGGALVWPERREQQLRERRKEALSEGREVALPDGSSASITGRADCKHDWRRQALTPPLSLPVTSVHSSSSNASYRHLSQLFYHTHNLNTSPMATV